MEEYILVARLVREILGGTLIIGGHLVIAMVLIILVHVYFRLKGY